MDHIVAYINALAQDPGGIAVLYLAFAFAIACIILIYIHTIIKKLWGRLMKILGMKLDQCVTDIIEDKFVCALSLALSPYYVEEINPETGLVHKKEMPPRITIDQARVLYARLAHLGFWGLHPRKFSKVKTQEDLDKLKVALKEKRAAREAQKKSDKNLSKALSDLLSGLEEEL